MSFLKFTVDADKCTQCDACILDCPRRIIFRTGAVPEILPQSEAVCLKCQHCMAVCPTGAVSILGLRPEDSMTVSPAALPTAHQMHALLRTRRSIRQYTKENVSPALIDELLATVANAPTGRNERDLRFLVVDDQTVMQTLLHRILDTLEAKIQRNEPLPGFLPSAIKAYKEHGVDHIFRGAPHLLVVSAGKKSTCGKEDVDLALAYFELLAQSSGLGTVWCGFLKIIVDAAPELRPLLNLGPDTPFYAMLFGYPAVQYARGVQRDSSATIQRLTVL